MDTSPLLDREIIRWVKGEERSYIAKSAVNAHNAVHKISLKFAHDHDRRGVRAT